MKGAIISLLVGLLAGAALLYFCWARPAIHNRPEVEPQADTIYLPDTSSYAKPDPAPEPKVIIKELSIPVPVADSAAIDSLLGECARLERVGDSLRLVLQRTQRHYNDTTYDAWVSGIDPRLDSIRTYHTNMIITKEVPVEVRKRWGLSLVGGGGFGAQGVTPFVGVGVTWDLFQW